MKSRVQTGETIVVKKNDKSRIRVRCAKCNKFTDVPAVLYHSKLGARCNKCSTENIQKKLDKELFTKYNVLKDMGMLKTLGKEQVVVAARCVERLCATESCDNVFMQRVRHVKKTKGYCSVCSAKHKSELAKGGIGKNKPVEEDKPKKASKPKVKELKEGDPVSIKVKHDKPKVEDKPKVDDIDTELIGMPDDGVFITGVRDRDIGLEEAPYKVEPMPIKKASCKPKRLKDKPKSVDKKQVKEKVGHKTIEKAKHTKTVKTRSININTLIPTIFMFILTFIVLYYIFTK